MTTNGLILLTPTSIAYTGTSATISANGSVEFSACSVLSLNGVFSADYDNYMVVGWSSSPAGGVGMIARLRASGSDATASNYTSQSLRANNTTITASRGSQGWADVFQIYGTQRQGWILNFYGPYLAQPTALRSFGASDLFSAYITDWATTHSLSTSYDGLTIEIQGSTFSGRVAVYGMRK